MPKELKVRIQDVATLEQRLGEIGAKFERELCAVDTYFNQPGGRVLKIVEDDDGVFLSQLESKDGGFAVVSRDPVTDLRATKAELSKKHGIHKVLNKRRRLYSYGDCKIDLNFIEGVGDFLVLLGEEPAESTIESDFGLLQPEYIRVPFSDL